MKKTIIRYGVISGIIAAVLMSTAMMFHSSIGYEYGAVIGYTGILISLIVIYFAMAAYRRSKADGKISFGDCMKIGLAITGISSLFYVAAWLVIYYYVFPDFWGDYGKHVAEVMRKAHKPEKEITEMAAQMVKYKEMFKNPLINAAFTIIEPLPVGILITLISGGIMMIRKKQE